VAPKTNSHLNCAVDPECDGAQVGLAYPGRLGTPRGLLAIFYWVLWNHLPDSLSDRTRRLSRVIHASAAASVAELQLLLQRFRRPAQQPDGSLQHEDEFSYWYYGVPEGK
jgi:hypothetical protein